MVMVVLRVLVQMFFSDYFVMASRGDVKTEEALASTITV
jgi:hypothetical protein